MTAEFVVFDHQAGTNDVNHTLELTKARNPRSKPQQVLVLKNKTNAIFFDILPYLTLSFNPDTIKHSVLTNTF